MVDSFFALSGYLLTMLPSGSPIFARYVTGIFNISCCAGIAWIFSQVIYAMPGYKNTGMVWLLIRWNCIWYMLPYENL